MNFSSKGREGRKQNVHRYGEGHKSPLPTQEVRRYTDGSTTTGGCGGGLGYGDVMGELLARRGSDGGLRLSPVSGRKRIWLTVGINVNTWSSRYQHSAAPVRRLEGTVSARCKYMGCSCRENRQPGCAIPFQLSASAHPRAHSHSPSLAPHHTCSANPVQSSPIQFSLRSPLFASLGMLYKSFVTSHSTWLAYIIWGAVPTSLTPKPLA